MYCDDSARPAVIRWEILDVIPGLTAACSIRRDGCSPPPYDSLNLGLFTDDRPENIAANRTRFFERLSLNPAQLVWLRQVHSATVRIPDRPGMQDRGDALVTRGPGFALAVTVADCVPLILAAPAVRAIAVIHAGWRGTAAGIVGATINAMITACGADPADICAVIGPHIRKCCFEVRHDVAGQFPKDVYPGRDAEHWWVDLAAANRRQLVAAGVNPTRIDADPDCTCCRPDRYFSHRRDGAPSGRHLIVAAWRD